MKVVSLALFGTGDEYGQYLSSFVLAHHNLFPIEEGWQLRVHIDDATCNQRPLGKIISNMHEDGLLKAVLMGPAATPLCKAMMWRMQPVFDKDVEYAFCRDVDAVPMPRDRACVEAFMAARATVSTIHDAPVHIGVMGGLCGFRTAHFRQVTGFTSLDDVYKFAGNAPWAQKGVDQMVLNRLLLAYPHLTLLEHRYGGWHDAKPRQKPSQRVGVYGCKAWSQLVPDEGWRRSVHCWIGNVETSPQLVVAKARELTARADRLGFHLGCAGYDHVVAREFWEKCGDPEIARRLRACES